MPNSSYTSPHHFRWLRDFSHSSWSLIDTSTLATMPAQWCCLNFLTTNATWCASRPFLKDCGWEIGFQSIESLATYWYASMYYHLLWKNLWMVYTLALLRYWGTSRLAVRNLSMISESEKHRTKLHTIFPIKHLNQIELAMKFRVKYTYVTLSFEVMLNLQFFADEILLQWEDMKHTAPFWLTLHTGTFYCCNVSICNIIMLPGSLCKCHSSFCIFLYLWLPETLTLPYHLFFLPPTSFTSQS